MVRPADITGNYTTWDEAEKESTGYNAPVILERTKEAALKVKRGEAVYERDSVLFNEIQYSYPVLAAILWTAARYGGWLNVLDFGGSLGTSYFQNHAFLKRLPEYQWNVVEQPAYVDVGNQYFKDEFLYFFPDVKTCIEKTNNPNVVLCSSSIQYVKYPWETLRELAELKTVKCLIIDRTPFCEGVFTDKVFVQKVPDEIYPAAYPIWIFSKEHFIGYMNLFGFKVLAEFPALDHLKSPVNAEWKGMIFVRENNV